MKSLFWNADERRLRALWRLLLQAALAAALAILPIVLIAEPLTIAHKAGHFLSSLNKAEYDRVVNIIVGPLLTAMFVLGVWIAARVLDRRPSLAALGVQIDRRWWAQLAYGLCLGGSLMTVIFVVERAAGWLAVTGMWQTNVAGVSLALAFSFSAVKVVCVGIYEEMIARGYQLANLREGVGTIPAVIISSAIFALLHIETENVTVLSVVSIFVIGLMFAAAVIITGRLSTSIGLHIAWNFFQGTVFGFPVNGDKEGASLFGIRQLGAPLITGGAYGPEGGLIVIAAALLGIAAIMLFRRRPQ